MVTYLDSSVALAHLLVEQMRPLPPLWEGPIVSSRLLEYEIWNRLHARGPHAPYEEAQLLLGRVELVELTPSVLARALGPFPIPVRTLDGLHLFGVRQALAAFRGRALPSTPFRTPGLYRLVRHPLMTGMLVTFWAAPTMTEGRLLLAAAMSAYILAAVKWLEERDLRKAFGAQYERYQREVPMLLPAGKLRRRR